MAKKKIQNPAEWEVKDRTYVLKGETPLLYVIPGRHTRRKPLLWFDTESGQQEELRYATNMSSPFVSEQKGVATLGHIAFKNGTLVVPKRKQNLQKLLSLYHPMKDVIYYEHDEVQIASNDLDYIEAEIAALVAAKEIDIEQAEAILRVEIGSKVSNMTSKEIKRDVLLMAKRNPLMFLELIQDDNVELRNIGIKAVEASILTLSPDNRKFKWASNGRILFTVPLDEHPYSALAAWFKTDEGMEVLTSIQKRL
tara:strand:- start:70 stop:828 length:759 start_codon:yes stop_codon:yes gene_type:complete